MEGSTSAQGAQVPPNKRFPVATGFLDYFPDAVREVANCSLVGNEQHSPGEPLHWAKEKSTDEADALLRHFLLRGTRDSDGVRHTAKVAWRAMALLQRELEGEAVDAKADADKVEGAARRILASLRRCPYADPDEEQRRRARAECSGREPC